MNRINDTYSVMRLHMRYCVAILFFLLFVTGCGGRYLEGEARHPIAGDWDKSVQYYQTRLNEQPEDKQLLLKLNRAKIKASLDHLIKGDALLTQGHYNEAISQLQLSIAFNPSNRRAADLIDTARNLRDSAHNYQKGLNLMKTRKYYQAREAFIEALRLNPDNRDAKKALAHFKKEPDGPPAAKFSSTFDQPVSFKFKKTSIYNVFEVLSRISGINFIFDKDMLDTKVTLFMTDVSFDRFLEVLLKTNNLAIKRINAKTVMVYPDTNEKAQEYTDLQIRTFYLSNLEAKQAVPLLAKIIKSRDIIANENMNAVVIRGEPEALEIAARIIEANDRATSEVLLNVEILEVSQTKEKQLGLEVNPTSVTFGVGESAPAIDNDSRLASYASIYALDNITNKELMLSLPAATLHLLKQDGETRVLAKPQIRVKNNEKATIHVGDRIPLRTNRRVDATGNITYDYQYQDVGVKVDAVPTINIHGEISLQLGLEISSLGNNVGTVEDPQYAISTRTAKSVLSMRDGEPVIIGGLITDEERETLRKIPMAGEMPIFGRLFRNEGLSGVNRDVLMSITPVIMRTQEIPGENVTKIWSGSERNLTLDAPYDRFEGSADTLLERPNDAYFEQLVSEPGASGQPEEAPADPSPGLPLEPPQTGGEDAHNGADIAPTDTASQQDVSVDAFPWPEPVAYSIHVNSYPEAAEAVKRAGELSGKGYECFIVFAHVKGKGPYYRVFVDRFKTYEAAASACRQYRQRDEFADDIHAASRGWAFRG